MILFKVCFEWCRLSDYVCQTKRWNSCLFYLASSDCNCIINWGRLDFNGAHYSEFNFVWNQKNVKDFWLDWFQWGKLDFRLVLILLINVEWQILLYFWIGSDFPKFVWRWQFNWFKYSLSSSTIPCILFVLQINH